MINKKLRTAIKIAEDKYCEAGSAVQKVRNHLVFKGFDDEPNITMCNGNELILEYNGGELNAYQIIDCMETKGFISKEDFR